VVICKERAEHNIALEIMRAEHETSLKLLELEKEALRSKIDELNAEKGRNSLKIDVLELDKTRHLEDITRFVLLTPPLES
jgi:hypothetical protein